MAKVLVFESDNRFASDVRSYLEHGGCDVTVVDDGTAGLQEASANRPDLILLSIELPRMNGFSVCNKLRRSPELKDIPLIIMSADSNEDIFEQHRRLRTRADEYLHKPSHASELREYIQKYVNLRGDGAGDELITDEEFELDEDEIESAIELDENELVSEEKAAISVPMESSKRIIDDEVDAFTETAFDAILNEGAASSPRGSFEQAAASPAEESPMVEPIEQPLISEHPDAVGQVLAQADSLGIPSEARLMARPVSIAPRDPAVFAERLQQLDDELAVAREQNEKLLRENHRLASDLDEANARAKQVAGSAGGSARENLDLRERVNQKERELLDLRDQQMQKEKELLHARDANLVAERSIADLNDKVLDLEKQLTTLDRAHKSAKADKDLAVKRAEDYRRKGERLTEDLQSERDTIAQLHVNHENALTVLRGEHESALTRANEATESARLQAQESLAEAERSYQASLEKQRGDAEDLLANRERELRQESDKALGKAYRAHDEALTATRLEHEARLASAQQQMNQVESEKQEVERVLADTQAALRAEQDKSARAFAKWQEDLAALDRVKQALGAGLSHIQEIESRPL